MSTGMDKRKEVLSRIGKAEGFGDAKSKAIHAKMGKKKGEREYRSKKAGYYVHGHKNFGDVYEK